MKIVVECNNTRRARRHREEGVCKLLTMSVTTRQELGVNARKEVECNNTRREHEEGGCKFLTVSVTIREGLGVNIKREVVN